MASEGIRMPGGMGGLMRYDEEHESKFKLSPVAVIVFVILITLFVLAMKIFWPVS
ncbi:MAG: preprotein translocase subunit Sec61beta [Candidatus Pacearchaeota archaeon]|nr:preprotein translocase subunit Sec61beta [Candidatus Pacearchaeota archaeon]